MNLKSSNSRDGEPAVMGIDPSLTGLAICVIAGVEVTTQRFTSSPEGRAVRSRIARYLHLSDLVMQVAERYGPRLVLLEGYSYGSQRSASIDQAELGGFLRGDLCELKADILEVAPATLKKFATGRGAGTKVALVAAVAVRWRVQFATDDEYDAYALARMARCLAGLDEPETQAQRQACETVLNGRQLKRTGPTMKRNRGNLKGA